MTASSVSNSNGAVWTANTPLHYVAQVIRKLDDGTYPTVPTRCFCGDDSPGTVLTERDRHTIPHRMVMCERCCLMRANPRMTEAAYRQFYDNEYRLIYDGFEHHEKAEDDNFLFVKQAITGQKIKDFLAGLDIKPGSVIDIGSDKGGTLQPFKELDLSVHGVEWCKQGRDYSLDRGIPTVTEVSDLIAQGITADLVIMQDIIEHFMDLRQVEQISKLLNPRGYLFICTPGFFAEKPAHVFQNAHTFQFIAATLEYVMNQMGYKAEFLDEQIASLWRFAGNRNDAAPLPTAWRKFITEHFQQLERRTLPPVRTQCMFTEKSMLTNLEANLKRRLPLLTELKDKSSGPVVVIGGGPSVDGQVDKIKSLIADGAGLVVIERMYPWCSSVGLKPDFVIAMDASDNVVDGFTHLQQGVKHLLAASLKPAVFDALKDHEVYAWTGAGGLHPDTQELWAGNGYRHIMIVNTGGTVVLASIMISLILGFRNIHLFGFDCSVPNLTHTYATDIAGASLDRSYFEIEVEGSGETVLTCAAFLAFAQQFFLMVEMARRLGMLDSIDVYGESLVTKMWDGDLAMVPLDQKENRNGQLINRPALEDRHGNGGLGGSVGGVL